VLVAGDVADRQLLARIQLHPRGPARGGVGIWPIAERARCFE
jgi:hypothetical protein